MFNPIVGDLQFNFAIITGIIVVLTLVILGIGVNILINEKNAKNKRNAYKKMVVFFVTVVAMNFWMISALHESNSKKVETKEEMALFYKNLAITPFTEEEVAQVKFISEEEKKKYEKYQKYYLTEKDDAGEKDVVEVTIGISLLSSSVETIHAYIEYGDVSTPQIRYQFFDYQIYNAHLILPKEMEQRVRSYSE